MELSNINIKLKHGEIPNREILKYLYFDLNWSSQQIADFYGKSKRLVIMKWFKVHNVSKSKDSIQSCRLQTNINKYGCQPFNLDENRQRNIKIIKERYGDKGPLGNRECREKGKITKQRNKLNRIVNKRKQTCLDKYGVSSYTKTKECKDKKKQTCIERYGVDNPTKTKEVQDKMKQTCLRRYNAETNMQTFEFRNKSKRTMQDKYGVPYYTQTKEFKDFIKEHRKEIQNKVYLTKKKNNSFNKSKSEEKCYQLLLTKFTKEDIERQYKSEVYPFACDFYIKSLDLYIEYNGTWTHGKQSFNKDNLEHQKILELWKSKNTKFFRNAIYTWTDLDVRKLETFKKNKLNYKIFWNLEDVKTWIEGV